MKFTTDVRDVSNDTCVAYLTHMEIEPENICLVIRSEVMKEGAVWMYYDGDIQDGPWQPSDTDVTKKFYTGDSVTITFKD